LSVFAMVVGSMPLAFIRLIWVGLMVALRQL
jgi:hypothetical protein